MKMHLNLLPLKLRRRQLILRRLRQWLLVWLIAAPGGAAWYAFYHVQHEQVMLRMQARASEYRPVGQLQADSTAARTEIEQLRDQETLTLQLADEAPMLMTLGVISRAAEQCAGNVCVRHLTVSSVAPPGSGRRRLLMLQGLGLDNLSVARFAASLRDAQVFEQVELKSTAAPNSELQPKRTYQLECTF